MTTTISARIVAGMVGFALLASALPAFAHNDNESKGWKFWTKHWNTSTSTVATSTTATYNVACVQTAVGTHEDAHTSALNTHNSAIAAALAVRKTEVVAAWAQLNFTARVTALKAAYDKYFAAVKVAKTNLKTAQTNTNTTFKTAMTACGATSADILGKNNVDKKTAKNIKMQGWDWLGFHLGFNL